MSLLNKQSELSEQGRNIQKEANTQTEKQLSELGGKKYKNSFLAFSSCQQHP